MRTYVDLDLRKTQHKVVEIYKQYDTSAKSIIFKIYDSESESYVNLDSSKMYATAAIRKPDGTQVFNGCTINSANNTITFVPTEQVTACPGELDCELRIYETRTSTIASLIITATFFIRVEASVLDDARIVSSDEYNALTDILTITSELSSTIKSTEESVRDYIYSGIEQSVNERLDDMTEDIIVAVDTANSASSSASAAVSIANSTLSRINTAETNVNNLVRDIQTTESNRNQAFQDKIDEFNSKITNVEDYANQAQQSATKAESEYNKALKTKEEIESLKNAAQSAAAGATDTLVTIRNIVDTAGSDIAKEWQDYAATQVVPNVSTSVMNEVRPQITAAVAGVANALKKSDIVCVSQSILLAPNTVDHISVTIPMGNWFIIRYIQSGLTASDATSYLLKISPNNEVYKTDTAASITLASMESISTTEQQRIRCWGAHGGTGNHYIKLLMLAIPLD